MSDCEKSIASVGANKGIETGGVIVSINTSFVGVGVGEGELDSSGRISVGDGVI